MKCFSSGPPVLPHAPNQTLKLLMDGIKLQLLALLRSYSKQPNYLFRAQ